jgi:Lactonase, 7-bladed beta-propeller
MHCRVEAAVASGIGPIGVAVSPDGNNVYVPNRQLGAVWQYDVGAGGALSPQSPATVATGPNAFDVAVSPDGDSAYVTNQDSDTLYRDTVSQYDVDHGGLSPKFPPIVFIGRSAEPFGIAVSPDGPSVYVANHGFDDVSQYDVGAGGALAPKTPATVPAGFGPVEVAVGPDGNNVYVTTVSGVAVRRWRRGRAAVSDAVRAALADAEGHASAESNVREAELAVERAQAELGRGDPGAERLRRRVVRSRPPHRAARDPRRRARAARPARGRRRRRHRPPGRRLGHRHLRRETGACRRRAGHGGTGGGANRVRVELVGK